MCSIQETLTINNALFRGGAQGGVFFPNLKSEMRINVAYGNQAGQLNAVGLNTCPAPVTIINANHYPPVGTGPYAGLVPEPLVLATSTIPNVHIPGS